MSNPKKTSCDVVIAGAGGAGLMAALTLAEHGADIKVFEKMPVAGGSTRFPEGHVWSRKPDAIAKKHQGDQGRGL